MKNFLVEFIGTFFLVFTIGCVVLSGSSTTIPALAIGFALMIMVYAGGHISGGHYNPAVSLAAAIRGALPLKQLIPYMFAQVLGGMLGISIVYYWMTPFYTSPAVGFDVVNLIIAEFLFTFALCYVVLLTATDKKVAGNSYYGLAIGSTVAVAIFAASKFCLTAFNPAVAFSLALIGIAGWKMATLTALVNLSAGIVAAGVYKIVTKD